MSKENYNALQIVPNFNFGIGEWNSFDAADSTTPEEDLINYLNGEVNVGNDNEAIHFRTLDYQPLKHFQPFCTENHHHHASKQQCSPPPPIKYRKSQPLQRSFERPAKKNVKHFKQCTSSKQ